MSLEDNTLLISEIQENSASAEVGIQELIGTEDYSKNVKDNEKNSQDENKELSDLMTAEEYLLKKEIILLSYEKQIFLDMVHSDALLVCAKGVSYDRALVNLLKVYSDNGNLILIVNSSDWEEQYYKSQLDKKYVKEVATNASERERVYLEGGIQFISTRILVVDLLKDRIPIELITGIVVLRAHGIIESCQEAFALRLYRQRNKTGFIKAFSNSAEAFTIGYGHIERTMRNLFVKELFIWPRFHAVIQESLKPWECQAIEFHVPMTAKMTRIQTNILDIMNFLVKEIKRINRLVDMEEITVENCVTKKFHKILQAQLDYIWHQLNSQTKLIVADLKVLRNLMISTIYSDSVHAYGLMKRYRSTGYAMNNSGWTFLDSAESLFKVSKGRVYNNEDEFEPELCPKWKALTEILRVEIPNDVKKVNEIKKNLFVKPVKVLILCNDTRTCYQLNQFLTLGGQKYLFFAAMKNEIPINKLSNSYKKVSFETQSSTTLPNKTTSSSIKNSKTNPTKTESEVHESKILNTSSKLEDDSKIQIDELSQVLRAADDNFDYGIFQESYILTMSQDFFNSSTDSENLDNSAFETFSELENLDISAIVEKAEQPVICIQTFKTEREGSKGLDRILSEFQPQYVIMYHCNVTAVRQFEVHEAKLRRHPIDRMRIFFLLHARTVEEQSYLTSLRREKQAFEFLIDSKKNMIIPEYQDGKTDEFFVMFEPHKDDAEEVNTRKAGGQISSNDKPKVIVDMREFRSDLPCLIHRRGIEILPVTITIGDYVLTPEICVERKSISDLIGSLNSGRLYNQCIQMQRYYGKPILLIEFDRDKPFHLQGKYMLSGDAGVTSNTDIVQKLQLLTLHFPKLRLIWSPSPYATAQLFEELKHGKDQPDAVKAAAIGGENSEQFDTDKFNSDIYDFVLRLPGVNSKNINKIMRNGGSLKELVNKPITDLAVLCDSEVNGKLFWEALHKAHLPEKEKNPSTSGSTKPFISRFRNRGKGRGGKRV